MKNIRYVDITMRAFRRTSGRRSEGGKNDSCLSQYGGGQQVNVEMRGGERDDERERSPFITPEGCFLYFALIRLLICSHIFIAVTQI